MSEKQQGGNNNRNRNQNHQGGNRGGNRNNQGRNNSNRNNQGGNNGQNRNNRQGGNQNRKPAPKPLTFWQKILALFGVKPAQAPQQQPAKNSQQSQSNTKPATTKSTQSQPKPQSKSKPAAKTARPPQKVEVTTGRLYVGNLSYETTEYDLEELFKGNGPVKSVEIIYNRQTHKSKGYGFIEMRNVDDAKNAVNVHHEQPFMGRNLIVNGAKTKQYEDKVNSNRQPAA